MSEKRIVVWLQQFKDRPYPVLQWLDPDTGRRKSKSAGTADRVQAEVLRSALELLLNGKLLRPHPEPSAENLAGLVAALPEFATCQEWVYFIRQEPSGLVKIGTATDVDKRLAGLQCASPQRLKLLGTIPGGQILERHIHQVFAPLRVRGEWFAAAPALLRFIRQHAGL